MKKIAFAVFISLFLAGCAAVQMQLNTYELMKSYTINHPADDVYATAEDFFNNESVGLHLTRTGNNSGVTNWKQAYKSQGSLSHYENMRYTVVVTAVDQNRSTLRVDKESVPDKKDPLTRGKMLGSEILGAERIRDTSIEFYILEKIDPKAAANLKARAAKM